MSVYITIKSGKFKRQLTQEAYVVVQSAKAFLKTHNAPPGKKIEWDTSLVCSIKEQQLRFKVCETKGFTFEALGEEHLQFTDFEYCPEKDFQHVLRIKKGGKQVGALYLNIFYTEKKNYLGDIEFYQFGSFRTATTLRISDLDQIDQGQIPKEQVIFYKGACKTKNGFSCCDQDTKSSQYEVVEDLYRDRLG